MTVGKGVMTAILLKLLSLVGSCFLSVCGSVALQSGIDPTTESGAAVALAALGPPADYLGARAPKGKGGRVQEGREKGAGGGRQPSMLLRGEPPKTVFFRNAAQVENCLCRHQDPEMRQAWIPDGVYSPEALGLTGALPLGEFQESCAAARVDQSQTRFSVEQLQKFLAYELHILRMQRQQMQEEPQQRQPSLEDAVFNLPESEEVDAPMTAREQESCLDRTLQQDEWSKTSVTNETEECASAEFQTRRPVRLRFISSSGDFLRPCPSQEGEELSSPLDEEEESSEETVGGEEEDQGRDCDSEDVGWPVGRHLGGNENQRVGGKRPAAAQDESDSITSKRDSPPRKSPHFCLEAMEGAWECHEPFLCVHVDMCTLVSVRSLDSASSPS